MISPRAGFGLVSLKTGHSSDSTNILAIGGVRFKPDVVSIEGIETFLYLYGNKIFDTFKSN